MNIAKALFLERFEIKQLVERATTHPGLSSLRRKLEMLTIEADGIEQILHLEEEFWKAQLLLNVSKWIRTLLHVND